MKPVVLFLVFNFLLLFTLKGQEITPLSSYLQQLEVNDPQRANHVFTLFYANVPSAVFYKNGSKVFSEYNPMRIDVDRAYYDKIDDQQVKLSDVEMLVVKFYKKSDLQFKINELILKKMPKLKYVVFVGEFDYTVAELQNILPTITKDIVFTHVKSIPS